jgi:trimeric autotransporter adhesin
MLDTQGGSSSVQARFEGIGSYGGGINIDNSTGGFQSSLNLLDAGVLKFQIAKQTNNSFLIYDASNTRNFFTYAPSNGSLVLNPTVGNVGIGTTSPGSILSVSDSNGGINFSGATSTFSTMGGINLAAGCYALNGNCVTLGSFSGTLAVNQGGTGSTTLSGILKGNGTGSILSAVAGVDYQAPITAGTGLSFSGNTLNGYWTLNGSNNLYNNNSGTEIGINNSSPSYPLDVGGFINTGANYGFKQAGNTILLASSTNGVTLGGIGALANYFNTNSSAGETAFGYQALQNATSSTTDTAVGYQALKGSATVSNSGGNTAFGYQALLGDTSGAQNIAFGRFALGSNTTGSNNIAVGSFALNSNVSAGANVGVGRNALFYDTTGSNNIAFGYQAGVGQTTVSDYNTTIDNDMTFIGFEASRNSSVASTTQLTNGTAIGYLASVGCSNCMVLGGTGANAVNIGIGTTSPATTLSVAGNGYFTGGLGIGSVNTTAGTLTVGGNSVAPGLGLAIGQGSVSVANGGSGYTIGDNVTLTCAGAAFSTNPVIAVTATSSNGSTITAVTVTNPGVATIVPGNTCALTQLSTSGSGTGAQINATFGPIAAYVSIASLSTGGGVSNGNLFLTAESPTSTFNGSESTFVGDRAGGGFGAGSAADTAVGHNSCGVGNSPGSLAAASGSFNSCFGDDAGRNISGTAAGDTFLGQGAGRGNGSSAITGSDNTFVGQGSGANMTGFSNDTVVGALSLSGAAGNGNTVIGEGSASGATGSRNTVIGYQVGNTNLGSGSDNLLISTGGASCDLLKSNDSNEAVFCAGHTSSPFFTTTGANTPSTSLTSLYGFLAVGTTTPYSRLEVFGPDTASTSAFAVVNSASTTEFTVYDTGNATLAGSLVQNSDIRLKTNISDLNGSSSLAEIDALNPVTFNWIDPAKSSVPQFGFIAQEVEQVFPNLVSTTSPTALTPDGTLSLNYIDLISPIVSAIQQLDQELTSLTSTVAGFAQSITSAIGNFGEVNTNELCDGSTCVTVQQLAALVAAESAKQGGAQASDASPSSSPTATDTPPVIQINGDNPAIIQVGASYTDLGATITGPQADLNLGIQTYLNGVLESPVALDTSAVATDTIDYVATDQNGLTSTSTRTVIVEPAAIPAPTTSASSTAATSTVSG